MEKYLNYKDYQKQEDEEYQKESRRIEELKDLEKHKELSFYQEIGKLLKAHRQARGWSIRQLEQKLNYSYNSCYFYESARRQVTLWNFVKLCRILKIDFRFEGTYRLTPEEREWVEAKRQRNYRKVIEWLSEEL